MKVKIDKRKEVEVGSFDFESFVSVQMEGRYNMFSPQARMLTGLDKDTYFAIIQNYDLLEEKYGLEETK